MGNILDPKIGSIVKHNKLGVDVYIISGYYYDPTFRRLSNFWYWKRINSDGTLSKNEESGYGSFDEPINNYEKQIKLIKKP